MLKNYDIEQTVTGADLKHQVYFIDTDNAANYVAAGKCVYNAKR